MQTANFDFDSFHPQPRTLMGPGPADVHPRVLEAMSRPTIGHLDPDFIDMMEQTKQLLQYAFQTRNELTFPVSAPGSAGMEICFVNLLEPGDQAVICQNGVFGGRMREVAQRCGATPIMVEQEWGQPVDPNRVEDALKRNPQANLLAFVHAETSTGAGSDARTLVELGHRHDCLVIVDAVTSLGGSELLVDDWQIDAVYAGTQKCLSCAPGIAPVSFSERARQRIRQRTTPVQSWFLDLNLVMGYWGDGQARRAYHHTAPVNALYGLHEALLILRREGLQQAWQRHRRNHLLLKAGLDTLQLDFLVAEPARLPQLNAVRIPAGVDDQAVRTRLLREFNLELGAGLGTLAGKLWRIGLMGYSSRLENILLCLGALETVLQRDGALAALGEQLQTQPA